MNSIIVVCDIQYTLFVSKVVKRGKFRNIPVAVKQMVENAMNEEDFIEEAKNMRSVGFIHFFVKLFVMFCSSQNLVSS